jgi:hypothetical protein
MKFKLVFIYFFIYVSQVACSQKKEIILKKCFSESTESFTNRNYICQKLSFVNQTLIYKINYSYNNWQIIDSVTYQREKEKYCIKFFQPVYDITNKVVIKYKLLNIDCNHTNIIFNNINDTYSLTRDYLESIEFLLSKNPVKNNSEYVFKDSIIPSLFTRYGIPYNEPLISFAFEIKNDIIENDSFIYENFILTRNYKYEKSLLKEVEIVVTNRDKKNIFQFYESFELKK